MGNMYESDLSISDDQASHRRMQAERKACIGLSTEELEKGIVYDMIRALSLAASSNSLPPRGRTEVEEVLARLKKARS